MFRLCYHMHLSIVWLALLIVLSAAAASAQTTQFTYQGRLTDGGNPANGLYDLQFKLYDALTGGTQVGMAVTREDVNVSNGIFSVALDFGAAAFPGANRFLEIGVRPGASTGAFTTLSPLQQLNATPYAVRSLSAATAGLADGLSVACVNCVTSSQINTVQGAQVTGNIAGSQISGLIPVASVPAGSGLYVQNSASPQASANFNISGSGTAGGTLTGGIVNALTQYDLGGSRVFFAAGFNNVFAGIGAGINNTTGVGNAFFGGEAGRSNTSGDNNAFFGRTAGIGNSTGFNNSFFGSGAGFSNTSAGWNSFFGHNAGAGNTTGARNAFFGDSAGFTNTTGAYNAFLGTQAGQNNSVGIENVFVGSLAGFNNTTGNNNTMVGTSADVSLPNLTYATAIGAGATVAASNTIVLGRSAGQDTVSVPGGLNVVGALNANGAGLTNLNANNIASGILAASRGGTGLGNVGAAGNYLRSNGTAWLSSPLQAADIPAGSGNYIQNTTTQQAANNFNISGNGTVGGTLSAASMSASLINTTTYYSLGGTRVLGADGVNNIFAGIFAGTANSGLGNSFFGGEAGRFNTTGANNSFFGRTTGIANTTGFNNSFFGSGAGAANTSASWNSFFGHNAGTSTNTGSFNAFFGDSAGFANTTGAYNSFFGEQAGQNNTTGGDNVFLGDYTGLTNTTGSNNTLVGDSTDLSAANLSYATALGAEVVVTASNRVQLGRNGLDTVSIGVLTSASATPVCINGTVLSSCSSSQRYKNQIATFSAGLKVIQRLRPVTFQWKATGTRDLGLIAEEVAQIDPLLVRHNDKGEIEGVKYEQLNVVLINALKEQQAQLAAQQEQINLYEARLRQQQTLITQLQQQIQQQSQRQQHTNELLKKLICNEQPQDKVCQ